jgi:hypothetical protein
MNRALAIALLAACSRAPSGRLELVEAPAVEDIAPLVAQQLAGADHDGKRLLVYIGASWCEPCNHFHDAAAAGQLDDRFGQLRLLVFDDDRDSAALLRAGYSDRLIPLFAIPRADGTASDRHIEGSIKGDSAVAQIVPRLQALLDGK